MLCNFWILFKLINDLSMSSHVTGLVRTSFAILRQLRSVSRSLTLDVTRHLVQSNPEPNRLLQRRLCRLATAQYQSASGGHQRCCSSGIASWKVWPHFNGDTRWASVAQNRRANQLQTVHPDAQMYNCAPRYLAESIRPLSDDPNRSRLRSSKSADVTIPRTIRLKWVIGPSGSLAHAPGTIFLDLFRHQDSSCVQETVKAPPSA